MRPDGSHMHVHSNQAAERGVRQPLRANKRARSEERKEGRVARAFPVMLSPRTDAVVLSLFFARSFSISICATFSSAETLATNPKCRKTATQDFILKINEFR